MGRQTMRVYGLTGGTGSGKSEAGRRLLEHGIPVIDADAVGHEAIAPGGVAEKDVVAAFGGEILTGGGIDRAKLGAIVFADAAARQKLNAIVHPAICQGIRKQCAAFAGNGHDVVIIDAALLGESLTRETCLDGLILVLAPADVRRQRLVETRGLTQSEADRRMAAQLPPEKKLAIADWVIQNEADKETLYARIDAIVEELRDNARRV
jgi:dephospho-CoA kinase